MSDTDIYKQREPLPASKNKPRSRTGRRRRRSSSQQVFDETNRRRRSKNTGLRRLLHLSRKGENENFFWWGLLIGIVLLLTLVGIWQFWIQEMLIKRQTRVYEATVPVQHIEPSDLPAEETP